MNRRLAVFDIDGTLFRWQLYYAIVLKLRENNFFTDEASKQIDESFRAWESRKKSFADFEKIAISALTDHLPRLSTADFNRVVSEVMANSSHKTYAYTRNLARQLKEEGYYLLAVSGSQQEIAEPFVRQYGFDDCIGWLYEQKDGYFTGKVIRNTVHDKAALIKEYAEQHDISLKDSLAIGDSKGDIAMLKLVDQPIAFNPSEELLQEALRHGWKIVVERKNIAYSLIRDNDGNTVLETTDRF